MFAGDYGEDFFEFKKDLLDAAKQNRTSYKNQITKLRQNPKSYAKSLVPSSITKINRVRILPQSFLDQPKPTVQSPR
jgi:hypothetical protein